MESADKTKALQQILDSMTTSQAEMLRHHQQLGKEWELLRFALAHRKGRDFYPYELKVRWPKEHDGDFFLVLRVATSEGGHVGFHSGSSLVDVLITLSSRIRSGNFKTKPDDYVPVYVGVGL